jgi:hypothetical protein
MLKLVNRVLESEDFFWIHHTMDLAYALGLGEHKNCVILEKTVKLMASQADVRFLLSFSPPRFFYPFFRFLLVTFFHVRVCFRLSTC